MHKKAISLVEVMVSVALISIIIVSILKIKDNNLFFIEKFKTTSLNNGYISLVSIPFNVNMRNEKIRLGDKINFDDDEIRRELKDIKIILEDIKIKDIELPTNDYIKTAEIIHSKYTIEKDISKIFYTFKLQQ
ncbi:MAG: hypothetical protein U9N59_04690 [Campylobacterota bacterium]|nr:hypothetical protein [Campylobacterota bacterium]